MYILRNNPTYSQRGKQKPLDDFQNANSSINFHNSSFLIPYIVVVGFAICPTTIKGKKGGHKLGGQEMKENRDYQLKVRLTDKEKDLLFEYAAAHGLTISEAVRSAIARAIGTQRR